jgi:hypothetical protein
MSTDATTFPLRDSGLEQPLEGGRKGTPSPSGESRSRQRRREGAGSRERTRKETAIGAAVLVWIGVCVLLIVLAAADRPSFLSSPSHYGFFPRWLAGPLGGLWPWFTRNPSTVKALLTGALVSMYVAYLLGLHYVPLLRARAAIATIVAVHAILLLSPPLSLTDVFNYINYGRMGMLHGLNPYTTIPALGPHGDPSYALSNWHQLITPYGPLFTLITYAVVPLGLAGSLWTFKALLMALSLGTLLLVWHCARLLGRDPIAAVVLVGLNPLILVWGLGGDHNDFFMVFCITLAFYLLLRAGAPGISPDLAGARDGDRSPGTRWRAWLLPLAPLELGAGGALAAAIALKASAAILLPVVLVGLVRSPRRLVQLVLGLALAGLVLGAATVAAFGVHLPDLGAQGRLVVPMGLPNLLGLALGQGGITETMRSVLSAGLVVAVAGCCVYGWRRRDALSASGWASMVLLLTLGWVLPWYVLWVLPLAALSRSRALRVTALVFGAFLLLTWMPLATGMDNALGIRPTTTTLGQEHQLYVRGLLD